MDLVYPRNFIGRKGSERKEMVIEIIKNLKIEGGTGGLEVKIKMY